MRETAELHGNRVKAIRLTVGMSSVELARRARVSRDALHRIENHLLDREPLVSTMRKLAAALELSRLADLYVIDGDGGLPAVLERRRPAPPPGRVELDVADRFEAVTARLPEPERLMLAELGTDTASGLRAGVRAILAWLVEHDGPGTVTKGRVRALSRTWLAAVAGDVGEAMERLDAYLVELQTDAAPQSANSHRSSGDFSGSAPASARRGLLGGRARP